MSNPDLPGPYLQDPGDAGYGSGRRTGPVRPERAESPWDDGNAGFWRDDRSSRGDGRPSRRSPDRGPAQEDSSWPGMLAGRSRRGSRGSRGAQARPDQSDDRGGERTGRFSQTADDLRSRLGVRGAGSRGTGSRGVGVRGAGSRGAGSRGTGSRGRGELTGAGPNGRPDDGYWDDEPGGRRGIQADGTQANRWQVTPCR